MSTSTPSDSAASGTSAAPKKAAPRKATPRKAVTPKTKAKATGKRAAPQKAASRKVAAPAKPAKVKKPKLVRDSFTIPKDEYAVIETLKQRAATLAQPVKKSELLRAGLKVLAGLSDAALRSALQAVPSIKTGRPKAEVEAPNAAPAAKANTKSRK